MKVKICGITRLEDALFCARAGADALGFIFYAASPRAISPDGARAVIAALPPSVTPFGVFVNERRDMIARTIERTGIRALQLSGDETPEECLGYGIEVVKAFRLRRPADAEILRSYDIAGALLDGASDGAYGGTGAAADTGVAIAMKALCRLTLAGGLSPETAVAAARIVAPYAIDVNSGVESSPGIKDRRKVTLLFERLRAYHETLNERQDPCSLS